MGSGAGMCASKQAAEEVGESTRAFDRLAGLIDADSAVHVAYRRCHPPLLHDQRVSPGDRAHVPVTSETSTLSRVLILVAS